MTKTLPRCSEPTQQRFDSSLGVYVDEPGRCDNLGRFQVFGRAVCGKHRNMLLKRSEERPQSAESQTERPGRQ